MYSGLTRSIALAVSAVVISFLGLRAKDFSFRIDGAPVQGSWTFAPSEVERLIVTTGFFRQKTTSR